MERTLCATSPWRWQSYAHAWAYITWAACATGALTEYMFLPVKLAIDLSTCHTQKQSKPVRPKCLNLVVDLEGIEPSSYSLSWKYQQDLYIFILSKNSSFLNYITKITKKSEISKSLRTFFSIFFQSFKWTLLIVINTTKIVIIFDITKYLCNFFFQLF